MRPIRSALGTSAVILTLEEYAGGKLRHASHSCVVDALHRRLEHRAAMPPLLDICFANRTGNHAYASIRRNLRKLSSDKYARANASHLALWFEARMQGFARRLPGKKRPSGSIRWLDFSPSWHPVRWRLECHERRHAVAVLPQRGWQNAVPFLHPIHSVHSTSASHVALTDEHNQGYRRRSRRPRRGRRKWGRRSGWHDKCTERARTYAPCHLPIPLCVRLSGTRQRVILLANVEASRRERSAAQRSISNASCDRRQRRLGRARHIHRTIRFSGDSHSRTHALQV
mmetsp:Transcript_5358/g.13932  ORF Transcript_5358/g.13932 Transcript_5358/m.13932 type:complete len:285 (-) Transcript_5358:789-1643(-)